MEVMMQQYLIGAVVGFVMAIAVTWIGSAPPSVAQVRLTNVHKPIAECFLGNIGKVHVTDVVPLLIQACRSLGSLK